MADFKTTAEPVPLPASSDPTASIVVLATRDHDRLRACLQAISQAASDAIPSETLVVLNDVDPSMRATAVDGTIGARIVETSVNVGTATGWNLAFGAARGRFAALLHEDSQPEPGWLDALVHRAETWPHAGVVGSRLVDPGDPARRSLGALMWRDGSRAPIRPRALPDLTERSEPLPVQICQSASMLVRLDVWRALGGFDEAFFPAMGVDWDFSTAVWEAGLVAVSEPASVVRHVGGAMVVEDAGPLASAAFKAFLKERAQRRFVEKWAAVLAGCPERPEPEQRAHAMREWLAQLERRAARSADGAARASISTDPYSGPLLVAGDDGVLRPDAGFERDVAKRLVAIAVEFGERAADSRPKPDAELRRVAKTLRTQQKTVTSQERVIASQQRTIERLTRPVGLAARLRRRFGG